MKKRQLGRVLATGACAAALVLGSLAGCGGKGDSGDGAQDTSDTSSQVETTDQAQPEADAPEQEQGEQDAVDGETGESQVNYLPNAQGIVNVGDFTFTIPDYWAGRVTVEVFEDGVGRLAARVSLAGNSQAELAAFSLVDGDAAEVAGDIGSHLVGSVSSGQGTHVEVWTKNWPWLAVNTDTSSLGISEEELAELVDLSTGGALTLDAVQAGQGDDMAESSFSESALASTVAFG